MIDAIKHCVILGFAPPQWMVASAIGGGTLVVLLIVLALIRTRRRVKRAAELRQDLSIDVEAIGYSTPPVDGPRLEIFGTPVRLAILILAPPGRGQLPAKENLRHAIEYLVPDFSKIVDLHQPIFRSWPNQLSVQGFVQAFFNNIALPGDSGKGTPWCSVAGRYDVGDQQLLVGLVCCAERPNSLGQITVKHEGLWHDVLRVRTEAS